MLGSENVAQVRATEVPEYSLEQCRLASSQIPCQKGDWDLASIGPLF